MNQGLDVIQLINSLYIAYISVALLMRHGIMNDDVISFDDVISYQATKKKQLTVVNVLILQLGLPSSVHMIVFKPILCYCRQ